MGLVAVGEIRGGGPATVTVAFRSTALLKRFRRLCSNHASRQWCNQDLLGVHTYVSVTM